MKKAGPYTLSFATILFSVHLLATFAVAVPLPECITDSIPGPPLTIINSASCGSYGIVTTRTKMVGNVSKEVKVQYMVHDPAGTPKAVLVLFAGGNGNTGITLHPDGTLTAGRNFLVRSAQLFAEKGYKVVTIDRPLFDVGPPPVPEFPTIPAFDLYRVSMDHRIDIEAVIAAVNMGGLPVFLVGTSRGAISAVAQHELGVAISLSSPVTSGANLYIGHPDHPNLQPSFITVPVRILEHELDACAVSTPQDAVKLNKDLKKAGVDSRYNSVDGGFDLTGQTINGVTIESCDALTHHGFLGIETKVVKKVANRLDKILQKMNKK